jgi:uncharacterized protein YciI
MYLLDISYSQSPANVEPHIASHGAWVKKYFDDGTFLFAGPKKSGLGGIILARSIPRADLEAILAADSYVQARVAEYHISEFDAKLTAASLDELKRS